MLLPRRRRLQIVLALVILLVLGAGAVAVAIATGLLLHDSATPVALADVVKRFEQSGRAEGKLDGVYLYATSGGESVDALGGAHHRYPATTTITVTSLPCGLKLQWEPLAERSATWTLCTSRRGIELRGFRVSHRFFGVGDTTVYACAGSVLVPADKPAGTTSPFHCRSSRGRETGDARVVGEEAVDVKASRLSAVHVRTVAQVTGGDHGSEVVDWWLDVRNGLPLRIDLSSRGSRPFFVGTVHFREDASLRLASTTPLR